LSKSVYDSRHEADKEEKGVVGKTGRRAEKERTMIRAKQDTKGYPSDLTDEQWALLEPVIPAIRPDAAYWVHTRREIVNAIVYVLRSGCPWRLLPHDYPAWQTVHCYYLRWQREGIWDEALKTLHLQMRQKQGRDPEPSAAVIDSQSIKTSAVRGPEKGYDAGKKNLGAQTPPAR